MSCIPSPDTNPQAQIGLVRPMVESEAHCAHAVRQGSCPASNAAITRISTSPKCLRAYAADLARRRILSQSKLQAEEERTLMLHQALKALSEEASRDEGEVASLRREVETMHAAYRAQLLRNEELECAMSLSEHKSKRRFEECLADAEETHCWEVAKLHNLLMESMLEVKTKMEVKEAELEEHRAAQDKMQQDMTAAKETIAMLKMQSAQERSDV